MTSALRRALGAAAITLVAPMAAHAQESTNRVGTMTDWNVFVEESPSKECWGVSKPKETLNTRDGQPASVRRGEILLFVTFRPGRPGEISFTGGYPFASGSTVSVDVDGRQFQLFTDGEWAWSGSAADDAALVAAMRAGTNAKLTARSGRGTQTDDTFSLRGFTAAMNDAAARCQ
ncbi:invasion associated locus B family protein [Pseudogemmobacter sonorensis]|uniref:invasion associated locus B family protein n=1 Tax=Pseudogemmobacter sonorensis TaxID=2989681 RepID=UPI0036BE437E